MRRPRFRAPSTPGEILKELYLDGMGITQAELARHLGCAPTKISEIVNGKRSITPDMAIMLGEALGTEPDFWLRLQLSLDLYEAEKRKPKRGVGLISVRAQFKTLQRIEQKRS